MLVIAAVTRRSHNEEVVKVRRWTTREPRSLHNKVVAITGGARGIATATGRTRGWGHSMVHDTLAFARRAKAQRVALFHHDPARTDARLDAIGTEATDAWSALVGDPRGVFVARERDLLEL